MSASGHRRGERGVVVVLFAFLLVALGAMMALSINTGHLVATRAELQTAADAAAYAAAKDLNGTEEGMLAARSAARSFAERHFTDNGNTPVDIDENAFDVQFGHWNGTSLGPSPNVRNTNAVCVQTTRGQVTTNMCPGLAGGAPAAVTAEVPTWFGKAFLREGGNVVGTSAVAVKGGPCKGGCDIPLVFAACDILKEDGTVDCETRRVFNADGGDNVAFTSLSADPTNPNTVRAALSNCVDTWVGETVDESNGTFLNPVADDFAARCGEERSAPVAAIPGGGCAKFVGPATIIGYTKVTIMDVIAPGGDVRDASGQRCDKVMPTVPAFGICTTKATGVCSPPDAACKVRADAKGINTGGGSKIVCLQITCGKLSDDDSNGCDFYGVEAQKVTLVR